MSDRQIQDPMIEQLISQTADQTIDDSEWEEDPDSAPISIKEDLHTELPRTTGMRPETVDLDPPTPPIVPSEAGSEDPTPSKGVETVQPPTPDTADRGGGSEPTRDPRRDPRVKPAGAKPIKSPLIPMGRPTGPINPPKPKNVGAPLTEVPEVEKTKRIAALIGLWAKEQNPDPEPPEGKGKKASTMKSSESTPSSGTTRSRAAPKTAELQASIQKIEQALQTETTGRQTMLTEVRTLTQTVATLKGTVETLMTVCTTLQTNANTARAPHAPIQPQVAPQQPQMAQQIPSMQQLPPPLQQQRAQPVQQPYQQRKRNWEGGEREGTYKRQRTRGPRNRVAPVQITGGDSQAWAEFQAFKAFKAEQEANKQAPQ
ncbi:hypothetical protein BT69DRAFT_1356713 [Atractiella rhizophila]|nr:hypothetical protein BT69DRAFT_1356713 [Atractiella rhizophila]